MTGRKVLGILLIVAAFVVMFTIPWGIMAFGPFWAFSIFLFLILGAAGGILMAGGSGKAPVEKPVEEPPARDEGIEPVDRGGFGAGYCPNCGSPIKDGDMFCGVCGRMFRWQPAV